MNRWIRRGAFAAGGLLTLAALAIATGVQLADRRMERRIDVAVSPVAYRDDAASVERGRYLYQSRGCADCHGANGGGRVFVDGGGLRLRGANITTGAHSAVAAYGPGDWVRTLRHGVKPDGRPVIVMPSQDYARWTDADVAAVVAYVRQLPPVAGEPALLQFALPVRVLYGFGQLPDAVDRIDHALPPARPVAEAVSVEHGRYVAGMCISCHGTDLRGGRIPGGPPDWPAASRLAPGPDSAMLRYAGAESFVAMMRSGARADGTGVRVMPFEAIKQMNDTDLRALHLYLTSLSATDVAAATP